MNVLVIYNTIPDEVKMAIVDMSLAEYNYFSKGRNYFINCSDEDIAKEEIVMVIDAAFTQTELDYYIDKQKEYTGKFINNSNIEDISKVEKMIYCGFCL